ncbi:MAG: HlyC/CorC family transporter [Ferruginibacter sp.]|nr:HlyC/CorC family transporter [Ferruginibacter sp.]
MDWIALFAILISLLLIGFLSGVEMAFVSANKLSIELRKKKGTYSGKTWGDYADKPARFIGTSLIAFNVILVVYGLFWSSFMSKVWHNQIGNFSWHITNPYLHLIIETIVSTLCLLFFEFVFKAYFRAKNETILSSGFIAYITQFFYAAFSGIASLFVDIAEWILKYIFNVKLNEKKDVFTKIDLEHFIQQSKNHDEEDTTEINKELFENALSLSEKKIRECLIPRKEIDGVDIRTNIETVKDRFIQTKLSKLVVYEKNIDNILGYVHQLDLFKNPADIQAILLPIPTIPESMSATDLMTKFSKERKSIAWVVDEFGGTAGIVTMEDLLEEIFGDIKDEYDTPEEFVEKQLATNEFIFSGRLELDYITEKYKLVFPDSEETETLSGFIIQNRDEIPKQKETFTVGNYQFDILNVTDTKIETVKMKVLK